MLIGDYAGMRSKDSLSQIVEKGAIQINEERNIEKAQHVQNAMRIFPIIVGLLVGVSICNFFT
jgi:hypothetical protein